MMYISAQELHVRRFLFSETQRVKWETRSIHGRQNRSGPIMQFPALSLSRCYIALFRFVPHACTRGKTNFDLYPWFCPCMLSYRYRRKYRSHRERERERERAEHINVSSDCLLSFTRFPFYLWLVFLWALIAEAASDPFFLLGWEKTRFSVFCRLANPFLVTLRFVGHGWLSKVHRFAVSSRLRGQISTNFQ